MYEFVTHTWNAIKGACYHDCSYCYMKRWGTLKPVRLDEKELKTDLGSDNFIFVGSSCDLFAKDIPDEWIVKTLKHCETFNNRYLFQTKNPDRLHDYIDACVLTDKSVLCSTIESDIWYPDIMGNCPKPIERYETLKDLAEVLPTYLTIEPILDFNLDILVKWVQDIKFKQVNIGADSGNNNLPYCQRKPLALAGG